MPPRASPLCFGHAHIPLLAHYPPSMPQTQEHLVHIAAAGTRRPNVYAATSWVSRRVPRCASLSGLDLHSSGNTSPHHPSWLPRTPRTVDSLPVHSCATVPPRNITATVLCHGSPPGSFCIGMPFPEGARHGTPLSGHAHPRRGHCMLSPFASIHHGRHGTDDDAPE